MKKNDTNHITVPDGIDIFEWLAEHILEKLATAKGHVYEFVDVDEKEEDEKE